MHQRISIFPRRGAGRLWVLLLLLLAACSSSPAPSPTTAVPTATTSGTPVPSQDKIGHVFLDLLARYQTQGASAARTFATDQDLLTTQGDLRVTLVLDSVTPDAVESTALAVTRIGGRVTQTYGDQIELVMPLVALLDYGKRTNRTSFFHDLADLAHVQSVQRTLLVQPAAGTPTVPPTVRSKVIGGKSEGVALTGADTWQAAGITGKGVKVGIIDNTFTNYRQFLSGKVTTRSFRADGLIGDAEVNDDSVHGTACAEIVREMAPDAELYLVAAQTRLEEVNATDWLTEVAKVDVVSNSTGAWTAVPTDGTSEQARAVDRARAAGVFYAILAGNKAAGGFGQWGLEGQFAATFVDKDSDGFHDFPGAKHDNGLLVRVFSPSHVWLVLQWDDWKQTHVNYDLYLYDGDGKEIARADDDQAKMPKAVPYDAIGVTLNEGTYTIRVKKVNPRDPDLPFAIDFKEAQLEQVTPAGSLWVPGDARGAITVAAINAKTDIAETYSSRGPTADGRAKPDLGAPDDVASYTYASVGGDTFFGTSAATPHVAGAAALYKQAFPNATPDMILAYLTKHAKQPKGSQRGENITGAGRLFLDVVPKDANTQPMPTQLPGTPTPTAVGTRPAGTPTSMNLLNDDFSSPASGLPAAGYRDGEYHIIVPPDRRALVTFPDVSVHGAAREVYQVQARRVSGGDEMVMGLLVHMRDADNYVVFALWNTGYYATFVKMNGDFQVVGEDGANPAIKVDGTNTLQVTVEGTLLTCAVNSVVVRRIELPDLWPDGAFGMYVSPGRYSAGGDVAFDNYSVTVG
jgi:subtilisin family serine protease